MGYFKLKFYFIYNENIDFKKEASLINNFLSFNI